MFLDQYLESKTLVDKNWLRQLGHRYPILMELFWAQKQEIPMLIPTTSKRRSELLCQAGFNSIHVQMAIGKRLSDSFGCDLDLDKEYTSSLGGEAS
ncbi:MAG: hypothetical protein F6K10_08125 [Moorea sp. SIO2B7]|nr:hypothetical protein [Moorena sp. SIO2B7]